MRVNEYKEFVLNGTLLNREQALELAEQDVDELADAADQIRNYFCKNMFDLCAIINAKSGRCSEDCKYCAQSIHYRANVTEYPLLSTERLLDAALTHEEKGIMRFSAVTSGRSLSDAEVDALTESYREIAGRSGISLCGSHGLLTLEQFIQLKQAGLTRYHNNLETSEGYFKKVCTTHTYKEKIAAIQNAQKAGLEVCSGGIIGLGEEMKDRIEMALALRELQIASVPINFLNPIKGAPFENLPKLSLEEIRKSIAVFRFILPKAVLRLAGGRGLLSDQGACLFRGGANAAISGDMLTTSGNGIQEDRKMIESLGFDLKRL